MAQLSTALAALSADLGELLAGLEPEEIPLTEVTDIWAAFAELERLGAAGKILMARRVHDSRQWSREGFAKPEDFFADRGGTSTGRARSDLETSRRLRDLEDTTEALRRGRLSAEQAEAISDAASVNPAAEADLIDEAKQESFKNLKDECGRKKAQADPNPEATRNRIHRHRRARTWTDSEGAWNISGRGTVDQGTQFHHAWDQLVDERFEAARRAGAREAREAYAFDALIDLARRALETPDAPPPGQPLDENDTQPAASSTGSTPKRTNPKHLALIRVDLEALIRGRVAGDELCEITGLGPLPVRVVRHLLGDSIIKLIITKGVDVANVTHLGRGVSTAQQMALLWTDPMCRVQGCHRTKLENDHREDWARTRHTRLDETDPCCGHHHDLKTYKGWAFVEGTGRRPMVPPGDSRHPTQRAQAPPGAVQISPSGTSSHSGGRAPGARHQRIST